jgi:hypothetical protein
MSLRYNIYNIYVPILHVSIPEKLSFVFNRLLVTYAILLVQFV